MKGIFTFLLLFTVYICAGQQSSPGMVPYKVNCWGFPKADTAKVNLQKGLTGRVTGLNINRAAGETRVILRCAQTKPFKPLLVVDGKIRPIEELNSLNPNDIFSIEVLKEKEATAKYGQDGTNGAILVYTKLNWLVVVDGILSEPDTLAKIPASAIISSDTLWANRQPQTIGCRRPRNVLLITTSPSSQRCVWVKDLTSGEAIPAATVWYAAISDADTITLATDNKGVGSTELLKKDAAYIRIISCVGYKTLQQEVTNKPGGMPAIVFLERDEKQCDPVVLSSIVCYRKIRCGIRVKVIREKAGAVKTIAATGSFRLFPNPVRKGESITMEWNELPASPVEYRLFTLSGALVERQAVPGKTVSGMLRINTDSRRAPGVYFLQMVCENGQVIASGKIILQ